MVAEWYLLWKPAIGCLVWMGLPAKNGAVSAVRGVCSRLPPQPVMVARRRHHAAAMYVELICEEA